MGRKIRDYIKYTLRELENYVKANGSCVKKINALTHIEFPPYGLKNFADTLQQIISNKKIGFYGSDLNGIILDIRNIKVLSNIGEMRFDSPNIHIDMNANFYVFQPQIGSVLKGVVKHISPQQIGVIIYRVFSVSILLENFPEDTIKINSEIEFRIKNFDLKNTMPFIEGELIEQEIEIFTIKVEIDDSDSEVESTLPQRIRTIDTTIDGKPSMSPSLERNMVKSEIPKSPSLFENFAEDEYNLILNSNKILNAKEEIFSQNSINNNANLTIKQNYSPIVNIKDFMKKDETTIMENVKKQLFNSQTDNECPPNTSENEEINMNNDDIHNENDIKTKDFIINNFNNNNSRKKKRIRKSSISDEIENLLNKHLTNTNISLNKQESEEQINKSYTTNVIDDSIFKRPQNLNENTKSHQQRKRKTSININDTLDFMFQFHNNKLVKNEQSDNDDIISIADSNISTISKRSQKNKKKKTTINLEETMERALLQASIGEIIHNLDSNSSDEKSNDEINKSNKKRKRSTSSSFNLDDELESMLKIHLGTSDNSQTDQSQIDDDTNKQSRKHKKNTSRCN